MQTIENIITNIFAISPHIKEYELVHAYFGPPKILKDAKKIKIKDAYNYLLNIRGKLKDFIPDEFPHFRRTYYEDIINSVLAQVEFFVFGQKKKYPVKKAVESFFAAELPAPFDLKKIRQKFYFELKKENFSSFKQFKDNYKMLKAKNFGELKKFVKKEVDISFAKIKKSPLANIDIDLKKVLSQFKLSIEAPQKGFPECYFYYKGNYSGVMGIKFGKSVGTEHCSVPTTTYIKGLVSHEISPGHHFYYMAKENLFKNGKIDTLAALDTFYSPETIINEGLAMSVDMLFDGVVDADVKIKGISEKYFHRVMYNIWHARFITKKDYGKYLDILYEDLDMPKDRIKFWLSFYFDKHWRYYSVSYAIGSYYIDTFLEKHGVKNAKYLYGQQSVNTLKKMEKQIKKIRP